MLMPSDTIQRIENEVLSYRHALEMTNSGISRHDEPTDYELYSMFVHVVCHKALLTLEFVSDLLDCLRPLRSASYNARCTPYPFHEDRKRQIISEIFVWANNADPTYVSIPVLLVCGDVRSASTTIAHGVAMQARNEGRLLASFFFSWTGHAATNNPANLIPTIMYQIALFDKLFLRQITEVIAMDRDIRDRDAQTQVFMFLDRALRDATTPAVLPLMVVIDALDVCDRMDDGAIATEIGYFMGKLTRMMTLPIKLLITSRFASILQRLLDRTGSQDPAYRLYVLKYDKSDRCRPTSQATFDMVSTDRGTSLLYPCEHT
jgi:hypothetical protein